MCITLSLWRVLTSPIARLYKGSVHLHCHFFLALDKGSPRSESSCVVLIKVYCYLSISITALWWRLPRPVTVRDVRRQLKTVKSQIVLLSFARDLDQDGTGMAVPLLPQDLRMGIWSLTTPPLLIALATAKQQAIRECPHASLSLCILPYLANWSIMTIPLFALHLVTPDKEVPYRS